MCYGKCMDKPRDSIVKTTGHKVWCSVNRHPKSRRPRPQVCSECHQDVQR